MSQSELAKRIGVSLTALSEMENGKTDPRASRIKKLAEVLGVSTDYLLGHGEEESEYEPAALATV
jgi:transcriptional regulator with XRE-family HTH domain